MRNLITLATVRKDAAIQLGDELKGLIGASKDRQQIEALSRAQGYLREMEAAMAAEVSLIASGVLPQPEPVEGEPLL